ncbi:helix-turn-helix domain-containing protein [Micromonospora sp. NPDC051925]|uniref:helix-turn-helix domain-containing protein n=1 Tax=Micromonospora sp. NPDC051925 TaxID=3364288 RepID=UPI0037C8C035
MRWESATGLLLDDGSVVGVSDMGTANFTEAEVAGLDARLLADACLGQNKEDMVVVETTDVNVIFAFAAEDGTFEIHFVVPPLRRDVSDDLLRSRISRELNSVNCEIVEINEDPECRSIVAHASVGLTVGAICEMVRACRLAAVIPSVSGDQEVMDRAIVRQLLRSGNAQALVGVRESRWFEVKSSAYELGEGSMGRIELAQDVARFANSDGGLLALGFRTKNRGEGDTVVKVTPLHFPANSAARYRAIIDSTVYPPIDGLTISRVPVEGGFLLVIEVPRQPESGKPYLVHGAIVNGKYEGSFFSVVRRRDENSIPVNAAAIHAFLAAGFQILRNIPDSTSMSADGSE